jgi:aspartate/methionine/tyrosine aminotransferase
MPSRRVPSDLEPTPWARLLERRRGAGDRLLDLTEANPTRVGLATLSPADLAALSTEAAARYDPDPRGSAGARRAVERYYAARGLRVDPEYIVLTSGTSEAYTHVFRLLADPGEIILVPAPSYPLFEPLAALEGLRLERYRLAWDGAWHLDLDSVERAMTAGVRGVVVVQPNHPTGSCLEAGELERLESLCEGRGAAILADEVFGDFPRPPSIGPLPSLAGRARVPTFVLSGLSKVCGLPGLKLSWIALAGPGAARAGLLRGLEWIADLFLSVSSPVQAALPRLLEARHAFQARVRERLARNLGAIDSLVRRRPELELLPAAGGWVAVLRVPGVRSEEAWALALLERGVVVHPGHLYDFEREAYLVLSLVVEPEPFAEGLARLEALLASS